jgi:hypothetical protein
MALDRDFVEIVIPWLALVVSVVALGIGARLSRQQNALQETENALQARIVELEEARERARIADAAKADLVAEHVSTVYDGRARRALRVTNRGRAPARAIMILVNNAPLAGNPFSPWTGECVKTLGPSTPVDYLLSDAALRGTSMFSVVITWDDDSGSARRYETELSTH